MTDFETRSINRDSLFLLADIQVEQSNETHRVRVRNLSDGGMMGEGNLRVKRGNRLAVGLRNVGTIGGSVAWVQDDRFGIAFDEEIDSARTRKPVEDRSLEAMTVRDTRVHKAPPPPDYSAIRKV